MSNVKHDNAPNDLDNNNNARNAVVLESEMVMEMDKKEKKGADNNQPEAEYDYELITNMKEYLIEEMGQRKKTELAEYALYKELYLRIMGMENIPESPMFPQTIEHGYLNECNLSVKLQTMMDGHLKQYYFYNQLQQVAIASPDNGEHVGVSLPDIYRPVKIDKTKN